MCDLNCRFRSNTVTGPLDMTSDDVLRSLKPFEADHSGSAELWFSMFDTPVGELVHLFTSDRVLGQLHSRFKCNPDPRIRNVFIELMRVQSVDYAPSLTTQHHNFFSRAEPLPFLADGQFFINLVCAARRYRLNRAATNAVAAFGQGVGHFTHSPFVIFYRPGGHFLGERFTLLILSEKPVHRPDRRRGQSRNW